jgi:hypothetical protein
MRPYLTILFLASVVASGPFARSEEGGEKSVAPVKVAGLTFTPPAGWKAVTPNSSMRKAEFSVAGPDGDAAAEVVFFYFGSGQGGSAAANVDRWLGQFKEPKEALGAKTETVEVGGKKLTTVRAEGTYLSGPPFGAKKEMPGYMLMGAIVPGSDGPVFIKMTGPAATVKSRLKEFDALVRSPFS